MYAMQNPRPMRYNPYRHNPLTRGQKIAIGLVSAAVVGTGAYLLWPKKASAAGQLPSVQDPKPSGGSSRPAGDPPPYGKSCNPPEYGGSNAYDKGYWNSMEKILQAFSALGYATPSDRPTMNQLGPNAALGGGDDVPNPEVTRFQRDYNAVSKWKQFMGNMGGLDPDGLVGPCTLNAIKLVLDNLGGLQWPQVVSQAKGDQ